MICYAPSTMYLLFALLAAIGAYVGIAVVKGIDEWRNTRIKP